MATGKIFNATCEDVDLLKCSGDYMFPCSCYKFYTCANKEMLTRTCGLDTAWNYKTGQCDHEDDVVFTQTCNEQTNVWMRCNSTDTPLTEARILELQALCTGSTIPQTTAATIDTTTTSAPSSGLNAGIVIGLIVAGAALTIIIIAAVVFLMRRKRANKLKRSRPGTLNNPEYFEGGNADDPYAVIQDNMMNKSPVDTLPRDQAPLPPEEQNGGTVYDNSAERAPTDDFGYTGTLPTGTKPEVPYDHLARENSYEQSVKTGPSSADDTLPRQPIHVMMGRLGTDTLGKNQASSEKLAAKDSGISVTAVSEVNDPDFGTPDYHVLEKI